MFRKLFLLAVVLPATCLIFGMIMSSCHWNDDEYVCGITFSATGTKNADTVLLSAPYKFLVSTQARSVCAAPAPNPFVSSCYAFKTCINWQNNLLQSSFRMTFDRRIVLEGDTVAAGANLLDHPLFRQYASFKPRDYNCGSYDYDLVMNDTLTKKMVFEAGVHKVRFQCITSDNKSYDAQLYVVFKP